MSSLLNIQPKESLQIGRMLVSNLPCAVSELVGLMTRFASSWRAPNQSFSREARLLNSLSVQAVFSVLCFGLSGPGRQGQGPSHRAVMVLPEVHAWNSNLHLVVYVCPSEPQTGLACITGQGLHFTMLAGPVQCFWAKFPFFCRMLCTSCLRLTQIAVS